jgi:uncharacterized protein
MAGLSGIQVFMLVLSAIIIGFSKTGIAGATLPAIAMFAYIFGGKESSGIMLTMLIVGDVIAVYNYGRYGKFKDVIKVLPPAVVGIALGAWIGNYLNDAQFKTLIGIIVLICFILIVSKEIRKKQINVPDSKIFHTLVGIISGFASMVGNASGPIFTIYLLSMAFEKKKFIGTTSWFFLIVNLLKVPFHIFVWGTITLETTKYTLYMFPCIFVGTFLGVKLVKIINEKHFRIIVLAVTAISAIRLFL